MTRRRMVQVGLGVFVSLGMGLGAAQAADIFPVNPAFPYAVDFGSPVTVALEQGGADVTDTWLPEPNQPVRVRVKVGGVVQDPAPAITLRPPASPVTFDGTTNPFLNATTLTTSAYPGQCGNVGNPAPLPLDHPDFEQSGDTLTPTDCGGFAVIDVTAADNTHTFIIPQDDNINGIPTHFEAVFCPPALPCPTGREDNDPAPVASTSVGDGHGAFDEYRGFMIRGTHRRTDPRLKDLFLFLANPQCVSGDPLSPAVAALSRVGGGTITYPIDGTGLFDNMATLFGAGQMHLLHTPGAPNLRSTEFEDQFVRFTDAEGVVLDAGSPGIDRRLNKHAVLSNLNTVKVLRVIECVDQTTPPPTPATPLAFAGRGINAFGYAILYTNRIIAKINDLVAAGLPRSLQRSTFVNGLWAAPTLVGDGNPTNQDNVDTLISDAMKHYLAHEGGHAGVLTPTEVAEKRTSYGYHFPPFTGDQLDQTITTKVDRKSSGFNTFYIPSLYNSEDKAGYVVP